MLINSIKSLFYSQARKFNWKYPYPKELQPKAPPEDERICGAQLIAPSTFDFLANEPDNIIEPEEPLSENDKFNAEYINKNPRNLEQMLLEVKPNGYPIDAPDVVFWNKLHFEKSHKHTTGRVVHNSGHTIVSASTKEWSIRKHLHSAIDANAVVNVARVLAHRCLQSGILHVHEEFSKHELTTQKVQLFLKTLEEEGLKTKEPSAIRLKDERYL